MRVLPAVVGGGGRGGGAVRVETHVLVDRQSIVTATQKSAQEVSRRHSLSLGHTSARLQNVHRNWVVLILLPLSYWCDQLKYKKQPPS